MNTLHNLSLCHEVQVHYKRPLFDASKKVSSSESAVKLLLKYIDANRIDHKEFFWLILLNIRSYAIGISEIGVGNTHGVSVNFKEILQLAVLTNAAAIIVAHNHPSGDLEPSKTDIQLTRRLKSATALLDITLTDHLIVTSEGFISLSDDGKM